VQQTGQQAPWARKLHNWLSKKLSGFKHFYYMYGMKKSCRDIQFLFNWKDSPQLSGT
jgi:hypothetical protein